MNESFSRTIALLGEEKFKRLQKANILLFGIGGVGGYIAEALVRSGIENLTIVDCDKVSQTNLNRQIIALSSTLNVDKVDVMKTRLLDINENAKITTKKEFINSENASYIDFSVYNYVIDAIDFVPGKIAIIEESKKVGVPIISCMGTGNKLHPEKFEIADISKTSVCPLAKVMRKTLKEKNIFNVPVLFSKEEPVNTSISENGKRVPASIATVPSIAGLLIANFVILELIK